MDDQQPPFWHFEGGTDDIFNEIWATDFDSCDFSSAPAATDVIPDNLNTLPLLDDIPLGNISLQESGPISVHTQPLGSVTLQQLEQGTPAPRQRTLPRRRSKYVLRRSTSQSRPIAIPAIDRPLTIQRWQDSPPEQEAASLSAIYNAVEERPSRNSFSPNFNTFRSPRGPSSSTSLDSAFSESSVQSITSNQSTTSQRRRRAPKPRAPTKPKTKPPHSTDRIFKCTFCCDTFLHKYDWTRHEKSLHLNLEEWLCTPHGAAVHSPLTNRIHCAYCSALDPTPSHLATHNHTTCQTGSKRSFRRKDHLVQHLRLVHNIATLPLLSDWKVTGPAISSRCGFCDARMQTWEERVEHLAAHFRSGKSMADWSGEHGFTEDVAARVRNDFPPYLLAHQASTPVPFSATSTVSRDQTVQVLSNISSSSNPTFSADTDVDELPTRLVADILTKHLAAYARRLLEQGVEPTDEMFQRESRRVMYSEEGDAWDHTIADDREWMRRFREGVGLGSGV